MATKSCDLTPPKSCDLTPRKKRIVASVNNYFEREKKDGVTPDAIGKVVERTAKATGFSERTVKRVRKELKDFNSENEFISDDSFRSPHKKDNPSFGRPKVIIDNFLQGVVRRRIHKFYLDKEYPTLDKVLSVLKKEIDDFPAMCKETLRKLLEELGFRYRGADNKRGWYEQAHVIAQRHSYLRNIRKFRAEGRLIFYQDETWCCAHHKPTKCWVEIEDVSCTIPKIKGGLKAPSGKGRRVIVNHCGSERGFVPNAADIFIGKTGCQDYHHEMNTQHWMEWFETKLLPNIPDGSVIVVDQAKYHMAVTEETRCPTTAWRKAEIIEWLINHYVPFSEDSLKAELLILAKQHAPPKEFKTDKIAAARNIVILRLPVGHCELNPIELIWAQGKDRVTKRNKTFKLQDVRDLCVTVFKEITSDDWKKCIEHVKKVEHEYWEKAALLEEIEPFIIRVSQSDGDSDSDYI